jgi:hypothetical protein
MLFTEPTDVPPNFNTFIVFISFGTPIQMGLHPKFGAKLRIFVETDEKNDKIVHSLYERPL